MIVSSIDQDGFPHSSAKAIVKIDPAGEIYLVDVYHGVTSENINVIRISALVPSMNINLWVTVLKESQKNV